MSEEESGGLARTVTGAYRSRADSEMSGVGLIVGLGLLLVMIPLLPFLVVLWLYSKLSSAARPA